MAPIKNNQAIRKLLLSLIASIFIGETLVMLFIDLLPPLLPWQEALFDSTLLLILTFPSIYFLAFSPLKIQLNKLNHSESLRYQASKRLENLASHVPGIVFQFQLRTDGSCCLPYASQALLKIYRVNLDDVREDASRLFTVVHPDDLAIFQSSIKVSALYLTPWVQEYRLKFGEEPDCWLFGSAMPQRLEDGSTLWHGYVTEITERKLAEQEQRIAAIAFESQEGIVITDHDGNILRVNQAFTDMTGYCADEVIGKNPRILKSGYQEASFYAAMWASINSKGAWEGEIWNRRKNGEVFPAHITITAVKNASGLVTNFVATHADITANKESEEKINNLAFYDPLTNLPNRRLLMDRLKHTLASFVRSGNYGAVVIIDLDNFKVLNDTHGHAHGDLLLKLVGQRLVSCVRDGDTVARLGGDEFVVLLEDLDENFTLAAIKAGEISNKLLAKLNHTYQLDTHVYQNTPSIGITLFSKNGVGTDDLLRQADIAMYEAKKAGRNTLRFYNKEMGERIHARAELEKELRTALQNRQFQLYYQIQVNSLRQTLGAEVLIRWLHPVRGLVSPAEFIPLAEETGMIAPIGQWVLEMACSQLKAWQQNELTRQLILSVNVSAKQYRSAEFPNQVKSAIEHYGIDPNLLKLELTESILVEDVEDTIVTMNSLAEMGIQFSLDDFGTGYSSLQYLKRLPLYQLKIDQSFVRDIAMDKNDKEIVITIIKMAQAMNLNVIAEGVETEEQLNFLEQHGCSTYQGYLFSKPVAIELFEALLKHY